MKAIPAHLSPAEIAMHIAFNKAATVKENIEDSGLTVMATRSWRLIRLWYLEMR